MIPQDPTAFRARKSVDQSKTCTFKEEGRVDFELALSPTGRFSIRESVTQSKSGGRNDETAIRSNAPDHISRLLKSFDNSNGAGLFELTAGRLDASWSPAFRYWRGFASRFLDHVCQMPDGADSVDPTPALRDADISSLILNVPPMPGAEYVLARCSLDFGMS